MAIRALTVALAIAGCGRIGFDEQAPSDLPPTNAEACAALPVTGRVVGVSDADALVTAVDNAQDGDTIELADGRYVLDQTLEVDQPGVTLRSASGDASRVILDGDNTISPMIRLSASDTKVISLAITNTPANGALVVEPDTSDITGTTIYDVTFLDLRGTAIRIRPPMVNVDGPYPDRGVLACSRFLATNGTGCDIDANSVRGEAVSGWIVRDNVFDKRACTSSTGSRRVWFRNGSADTVIAGNRFIGSTFNVMLGGFPPGQPRRGYPGLPPACNGIDPDHLGGLVCNNAIATPQPPSMPADDFDFAEGIALWSVCETWVMHNTIVAPVSNRTFSTIEHRYDGTFVHLVNNLLATAVLEREASVEDSAYATSNVLYGSEAELVDPNGGDLRLSASAPPRIGASIAGLAMCNSDAAGKPRPEETPTIGAFEP